ncbi:hypothetical protein VST7929_01522 [Vibrio stylophorae]|uniref:YD repeat-containing protein n=1 Tax=Vibrio stylophorae TaxID=659351 RepID=A0ABM8ZTL6_9VIBR|nr:RHS repeat domain-containing protein [Vibrio stylophorae]CAH0533651.1 hypothetical protein VST7929_01522 [Vibrio stylophorae]
MRSSLFIFLWAACCPISHAEEPVRIYEAYFQIQTKAKEENSKSLSFLSNGDQILTDKNGPVIKTNDGVYIRTQNAVDEYIKNSPALVIRTLYSDSFSTIDFNHMLITRPTEVLSGAKIQLIYDNYGQVIQTIDSAGPGRTRTHRYDKQGQLIETHDSLVGIIHHCYRKDCDRDAPLLVEKFDGTEVYMTRDELNYMAAFRQK